MCQGGTEEETAASRKVPQDGETEEKAIRGDMSRKKQWDNQWNRRKRFDQWTHQSLNEEKPNRK